MQWAYQIVWHEGNKLRFQNWNRPHRLTITHAHGNNDELLAPQFQKDFQEVVLGARQDECFRKHMCASFGDLGMAEKALVGL